MFRFLSGDPLISLLKSYGYNVVRLPKATIKPLQLMASKNNELSRVGELSVVFKSKGNIPQPTLMENSPVANISGKKSGEFSLGFGLSILGNIISGLGGSTAGLESKFSNADSIAFQYEGVLEDSVDVAELDQFLCDADISPFSRFVGQLLDSDKVYVVTATIKSKKFTIFPQSSKGGDLGIQVPVIQNVVSPTVKVTGQGGNSSAITFEGATPLVFGFQAVQLFYDRGRYTRIEPAQQDLPMRGPSNVGGSKLISPAPFVSLGE